MSNRICNFSDLVQRVTANCLLHPLGSNRFDRGEVYSPDRPSEAEDDEEREAELSEYESGKEEEIGVGVDERRGRQIGEGYKCQTRWTEKEEAVALMGQVFEAASAMKRAYANLQEAHCPWDPAKMRSADEVVVAELRRIGLLRERFKRGFAAAAGRRTSALGGVTAMREAVAPYEAAIEELKREVKAKEMEIESLRERLKSTTISAAAGGRKGRLHSKRKVSCSQQNQVPISPSPDLFEATMSLVRETSKSFAGVLLSLMRSAHWDISAAVRSIESATTPTTTATSTLTLTPTSSSASSSPTGPHHARYALESYITKKLFQGFDHETFYMDGTLLSLLNPDQFRRDCFSKYRDMKSMDPAELLGVTPSCQFGVFSGKKYLAIMHPKMEESLFGDLEHRSRVSAGEHPRTAFYGEFLAVAKAVWLLHLLAFSLDPAPSHFEATRGAEFHPVYMESVVKFPSGKVPPGQVVGLPVSPGFKIGSGSVIKARVYLVNRS